eukprot:gene27040-8154_t
MKASASSTSTVTAPKEDREMVVLKQMQTPKVDDAAAIIFASTFGIIAAVAIGL